MDKEANRKIGLIAGSFDLIHPGYVRMFKESKKYCNYLIVALQDDPTVDRPSKCKPIHSINERREILMSLRDIDDIVVYTDEKSLYDLLKSVKYDIRILGEEYKDVEYNGKDLGKDVAWITRDHEYSTTSLKEKIYMERKHYKEFKLSTVAFKSDI
jgi:glycerol-3-phosphate cytidylyltransferase